MNLEDHPTVRRLSKKDKGIEDRQLSEATLEGAWLRRLAIDYRRRISDVESSSMWQSLSHGANYKSAYCMAVCPAGEDVIGPGRVRRERAGRSCRDSAALRASSVRALGRVPKRRLCPENQDQLCALT